MTVLGTGFLEKDDYDRLLAELPEYLKLALVIAYHTSCRRGAQVTRYLAAGEACPVFVVVHVTCTIEITEH